MTILIQSAIALLLLLGSALLFNQVLELDAPDRRNAVPARPSIRRHRQRPQDGLKKAA